MTHSEKADATITTAALSAAGAAIIPVPVADVVVISGVQLAMVGTISSIYGKVVDKNTLKGLAGVCLGANVGMWIWSLVKTIPGLGTVTGAIGQMAIASAVTVAIGKAFKYLCEHNRPFTTQEMKSAGRATRDEVSRTNATLKAQLEKTERYRQRINFHAVPDEFLRTTTLHFDLSGMVPGKLEVFDVNRNIVFSKNVYDNSNQIIVDLTSYPSGKYDAQLSLSGLAPYHAIITKK